MTFSIKSDPSGQTCVFSDKAEVGGNAGNDALVLDHVVYDHANGHAYLVDPQKHALARLSPMQAEKLRFCEKQHPRADADIFTGEPPSV